MIPFSARMYRDTISYFRATSTTTGQGANRPTFPTTGVDSTASVQSQRVDRMDAQGRTFSVSMCEVYTPENIGARTADKIVWVDHSGASHTLSVEAGTVPKGIGDVTWCTYCVETK